MAREKQRVFNESLTPKKLIKENKLTEGKRTTYLVLNVHRDEYSPDEIEYTLTVEELIDALQSYAMDTKVLFGNDRRSSHWYTYGSIKENDLKEYVYESEEDDDYLDESKEQGRARFSTRHRKPTTK